MNVDEFDYELPEELIAQEPLADRAGSRLLVLRKKSGEIAHERFRDLGKFLRPGDALILNDTRVIPARLYGRKTATGARVELLLLRPLGGDRWETLARPAKRLKAGTTVEFAEGDARMTAVVEREEDDGRRIVRFEHEGSFESLLERIGRVPLPPYIRKPLVDRDRYQTVYARRAGSAAAPTAGLHFTEEMLETLRSAGIRVGYVTLHVGLGTFRPVTATRVEDHRMHAEVYEVPAATAELVNTTRRDGGRVVAVGTTVVRTLESAAKPDGTVAAQSGETDLFIYPGYRFRAVDALITNFHLPKSTLLMLVCAFAGRNAVLEAYRQAVELRYRFFSFGDAMLIID